MKKAILGFLAGSFFMAFPLAMAADQQELDASVAKACKADIEKFCSDITPGGGRIAACLKSRDDKISQECKQAWEDNIKKWAEFLQKFETACSKDVEQFCQTAESMSDVIKCLVNHQSDLSSTCKSFADQHPNLPS